MKTNCWPAKKHWEGARQSLAPEEPKGQPPWFHVGDKVHGTSGQGDAQRTRQETHAEVVAQAAGELTLIEVMVLERQCLGMLPDFCLR